MLCRAWPMMPRRRANFLGCSHNFIVLSGRRGTKSNLHDATIQVDEKLEIQLVSWQQLNAACDTCNMAKRWGWQRYGAMIVGFQKWREGLGGVRPGQAKQTSGRFEDIICQGRISSSLVTSEGRTWPIF